MIAGLKLRKKHLLVWKQVLSLLYDGAKTVRNYPLLTLTIPSRG